jgi:general secretion pathway protein J
MSRGFTLLELLISIAIFSTLGLGAYQMLQTVTRSHENVQAATAGHTQLNFALSMMQKDLGQFVPRIIRDEYGEPLPPITFQENDYVMEFTRLGWSNPAGRQRSNLQRVAYSVDYDTEELKRHFWEVLDRAEDSEPVTQVLLSGVTELMATGYTDEDDSLEGDFSLEGESNVLPRAVEVTLSTTDGGDVQRIFELVDSPTQARDNRETEVEQPPGDAEDQVTDDGQNDNQPNNDPGTEQ